jgi:hypothetical protein
VRLDASFVDGIIGSYICLFKLSKREAQNVKRSKEERKNETDGHALA